MNFHINKRWFVVAASLVAVPLFLSCNGDSEELTTDNSTESVEQRAEQTDSDRVLGIPAVTVSRVKESAPRQSVRFSHVARGVNEAKLSAQRPASIEAIVVSVGDLVKKGDPLILLERDVEELAKESAAAAVAAAEANLRNAEMDWERAQRLFTDTLISEAQRDRVELSERQALANLKSAKANLGLAEYNLKEMTIRAPIDGEVGRLPFEVGETPPFGATISEVIDRSQLIVDLFLSERDLASISVDAEVIAKSEILVGVEFNGSITSISPKGDDRSKLFAAEALIENPNLLLRSGMNLSLDVYFPGVDTAVYIPRDVIIARAVGQTVALYEDGVVRFQPVSVGRQIKNTARILSGLEPDDVIIVSGMESLIDGDSVRIIKDLDLDSLLD